jgi:hypothetical protein
MLIAPRQWTAANFTFQVSIDGQIPLAITDVLRSLRPDGDAVVDIQIKGSLLLRPFYAATAFDYRYDKIFLCRLTRSETRMPCRRGRFLLRAFKDVDARAKRGHDGQQVMPLV